MSEDREYIVDQLIYDNEDKFYQYRLTVSEFHGVIYLNIRKYFLSFEGEYVPSKEGATFPLTIPSLTNMFTALLAVATKADKDEALTRYFAELADKSELD